MALLKVGWNQFGCDSCPKKEWANPFPKGWKVLLPKIGVRKEVEHICNKCDDEARMMRSIKREKGKDNG